MTEAEWLAATDPGPMLEFVRDRATDRKLRLFAVACCRRVWPSLTDERSRTAVEAAEQFADGAVTSADLRSIGASAEQAMRASRGVQWFAARAAKLVTAKKLSLSTFLASTPIPIVGRQAETASERREQVRLVVDIIGNPWHAVTVERWLTLDVVGVARGIYEDRAFDRTPILADCLMDAGCDDATILNHLRDGGPHVRGCHVVDAILGKA